MNDKVCSHCQNAWPRTDAYFSSHPNTVDRLTSWCRACMNENARNRYRTKRADAAEASR